MAKRVSDALREAAERLAAAGVDAPRLDAERLLAHALGWERARLYAYGDAPIPPEAATRFHELIARRAAREPLQHLLGWTEFWSLRVRCDRRALIPRPETELAVQAALDHLKRNDAPMIAEIGAGTGCIAIALAKELPRARIVASDISPDALSLAAENLREHGVEDRVRLLQGDMAAPFLAEGLAGVFDLVISNPPYIPDEEMPALQPEVRDHDPHSALRGGPGGMTLILRLLREIRILLRPGAFLVMEVGIHQARLLAQSPIAGWELVEIRSDAGGVERVVVERRIAD